MRLDAGNVLAAKMNAHRHQWNGTICSQPQSWNCGADATFRASYCDSGMPRCFHLDVFKPNAPRLVTPDSSVVHALLQQPRLLDDQLLALYGGRFGAQQGIARGDYEQTLFGFYRVKKVSIDGSRTPHRIVIEPYDDEWVMFPRVSLRPPVLRAVPGIAYLKQIRAKGLKDAIDEALESATSLSKTDGWTSDLQKRLVRSADALPLWLQQAEQAVSKLPPPTELPRVSVSVGSALEGSMASKLKGIKITPLPSAPHAQLSAVSESKSHIGSLERREPDPPIALTGSGANSQSTSAESSAQQPAVSGTSEKAPDPLMVAMDTAGGKVGDQTVAESLPTEPKQGAVDEVPSSRPTLIHPVPEPQVRRVLTEQFGLPLVDALSVAFITKGLVILTGAPGAGKSWIASRLLDDDERHRTVIVPVASTWRGREDLLGYVNPISGNFEATEFTHFLCEAQHAWETGDRRARLVVFEEFNLSQPEHWLSDLLVRLEYDSGHLADRTIRLGGNEIAGRPGRTCSVTLVPTLRFVATLNNDHTVKPLSPRVLDRAALIEVTSSGRAALSRAGVELGDDVEDVIDELNDLLEPRGAAFSVRSARSLQRAIEAGSSTGMSLSRALDLVLAQEVLSRVRLLTGDPRDEQLLARLQSWTQKPGCAGLTGCAARIGDWADLLNAGRDVFQA